MPIAMTCHRYGLANLRSESRVPEAMGDHQVRVAINAVALNYRDVLVMRGTYGPDIPLPIVPCSDAAGVVTAVGPLVTDLKPGARVCTHMIPDWLDGALQPAMRATTLGGPGQGVLCEERVLPRTALVPIPSTLSFDDAACLPVAGLAAWSALVTVGSIGPGHHILLIGTGGVSMLGLQIAKALGASVAVVSSSDEKLSRVRSLGADFTANYRHEGWGEMIRHWSGAGVDVVLELGGTETFGQSVVATRDGGCIALLGLRGGAMGSPILPDILMRQIRVQGIFVGSHAELERCVSFVDRHAIRPIVDCTYEGLAAARHAFAYFVTGRHLGKIVVRVT